MTLEMFGIYDLKALCYGTPMYATTVAVGKRLFADLVNTPDSMCNKHPDDYTLNHLGTFDDSNGVTVNFDHMVPLGAGRTYLTTETRPYTKRPETTMSSAQSAAMIKEIAKTHPLGTLPLKSDHPDA